MAQFATRPSFDVVRPAPASTMDQIKLDRLRELRATIVALRTEQESEDPVLAWVMAQRAAPTSHD